MFEFTIKSNVCYELTWEAHQEYYDQRDGLYINSKTQAKQFATVEEAREFQRKASASDRTKNWLLVKKEIIPL